MTSTDITQIRDRVRSKVTRNPNGGSIYKQIAAKTGESYMYIHSFFNRNKYSRVRATEKAIAAAALEVLNEVEKGGEDE